jgi:uncharacterized protein (TIRG00374 family)
VKKNLLIALCKYGLGIGLLAYVMGKNWDRLAEMVQRPLQVTPLACAITLCLVAILLTFYRWYLLVRALDLPCTLGNAMRLGLMGFFFSNFLPSSVGGDIIKAAFLARQQARRTAAVATVMLDRAIGLWALFWLVALLGGIFWLAGDPAIHNEVHLQKVVWASAGLVAFTSLLWCVLLILPERRARKFAGRLENIPKIGHSAAEFWRAIWMYRNRWRWVIVALLMSLVSHCCFVLTYYFAAQAFLPADELGTIPTLAVHFLIVPVGMAVQGVVPIPGGIGVGEAAFGKLYEMVGKPEANGVFMSFVYRVITWALSFIGYVVYLSMRTEVAALQKEAEIQAATAEAEGSGAEEMPSDEPAVGVPASES